MSVTLSSPRINLKRSSRHKSNVVDVPNPKRHYVEPTIRSDRALSGKVTYKLICLSSWVYFNTHSTVLQNIWRVHRDTFYLSMNNDGDMRALTGEPNPDFGPSKDHLISGVIRFYALC